MDYSIESALLLLSESCNLKCKYCYETMKNGKLMTTFIVDRVLDFMYEQTSKEVGLALFGGEPLINFGTVKYTMSEVAVRSRKTKKPYYINLSTNGTLWYPELEKWLSEDPRFFMQISIDGTKKEHMEPRLGWSKYSIKDILNTTSKALSINPKKVNVRATITENNLEDMADILISFIEFGAWSIDVIVAIFDETVDEKFNIYENQLKKIVDFLKKFGPNSVCTNLFHKNRRLIICPSDTTKITINAEGKVYCCPIYYFRQFPSPLLGDLTKSLELDISARNKFFKKSKEKLNDCTTCTRVGCVKCTEEYSKQKCTCAVDRLNKKYETILFS